MRTLTVIVLSFLVVGASGSAMAGLASTVPDAVDTYVAEVMGETHVPGVGLVVVRGGDVVHAAGYGEAAPGLPVTPQTPFLVASVTKSFTALLMMQLADEGVIDLDATVRTYVPDFAVRTPGAADEITIRDLLSHTSGLPSLTQGEYDRILQPPTPADVQREVANLRTVALIAEPGARFQYSNPGFTTLAGVIEAVTGQSYEEVLESRLFRPAGMDHAYTSKDEAEGDGMATGHRIWLGRAQEFDWSYSRIGVGAGFTLASAEDLARFATLLLEQGALDGRQIVSPESVAAMQEPVTPTGYETPLASGYGLGFFTGSLDGERIVHHSGVAPNYFAEVLFVPDQDLAVAVVMNGYDALRPAPFTAFAAGVASIMLGEAPPVPADGGDFMLLVRNVILAGDAVLLVVAAVTLALAVRSGRRRGRRRGRRIAWALGPSALLGGAWVVACLVAVPAFMRGPLAGLTFEAPELGYTLVVSAGATVVWWVLALVVATRPRPATRATT